MATSNTQVKDPKSMTKAQRKALAAKVAKAREQKLTGQAIRDQFGAWLTGPERRKLLREFGHDGLIAQSYDRQEAKAKREAKLAAVKEASTAKKAKRQAKPAQAPEKAQDTAQAAS